MATATNTTEGQILLSGDLTGTGENPELRASGVVPRAYNTVIGAPNSTGASVGTVPKMVIDSKGRVVYASTVSGNLQFQVANSTTNGLVKVDGTTVTVSGGVLSSALSNPPIATSSVNGAVKGGGGIPTGITFDDMGEPNYPMFAVASMRTDRRGRWVPDRTTISIDNNSIASAIRAKATSSTIGVVKPDNSTILVDSNGTITAVAAPIATSSTTGIVKVGNGLSVDGAGTISVTTPWTSPIATASSLGGIKPGTNIVLTSGSTNNATISVPTATSSVLGICRPDNSTVTISGGVLTSIQRMPATSSTLGICRPDNTTLVINSGVISVPTATSSVIGVCRPDNSTITVSGGVLTTNTSLSGVSVASNSVLGKVKIGTNIISAVGQIYLPMSTSSSLGVVKGGHSSISVTSGIAGVTGNLLFTNTFNTLSNAQFVTSKNGGIGEAVSLSIGFGQDLSGVTWSNNLYGSMSGAGNITLTYDSVYSDVYPPGSRIQVVANKTVSTNNIMFGGDLNNRFRIAGRGTSNQLSSHGTYSAGAILRFEVLILKIGTLNIGLVYNETYN